MLTRVWYSKPPGGGEWRSPFSQEDERPLSGGSSRSVCPAGTRVNTLVLKQEDAEMGRAGRAESEAHVERPCWHPRCRDVSPTVHTRLSLLWCHGARGPIPPVPHSLSHSLSFHTPSSCSAGPPICPLAEHLHRQISKNHTHMPWGHPRGSHGPCPVCVPIAALPPKSHGIPWQLHAERLQGSVRSCVLFHLVSYLSGTNHTGTKDV